MDIPRGWIVRARSPRWVVASARGTAGDAPRPGDSRRRAAGRVGARGDDDASARRYGALFADLDEDDAADEDDQTVGTLNSAATVKLQQMRESELIQIVRELDRATSDRAARRKVADECALVAEQELSFDMRFERDEAIDYTCYMLQRMYHDGFSGALKMFTEEYGWIKYSGRCTSPLITNDDDFVDVVANGYTAYSSTVAQEDSVTEHVIDLTTDVNYMQ